MARKPLTKRKIAEAALRLVDREGLSGFSMRKLGRALGVEAMSLYHHFPSQRHLFDAVMDALIDACPHAQEVPGRLEDRLRATLRGYRDMARRHPRFFPYIVEHRWNTEATLRYMEQLLATFVEAGHDVRGAVEQFRIGGYFLGGCAIEESAELSSAAEPVSLEEQRVRFPVVYAAAPWFAGHRDDAFERGVALLVENLRPSGKRRRGGC